MIAFINHFSFEFRTGIRNKQLLLMNYLFPLGFYLMMGYIMPAINPLFLDRLVPALVVFAILAATLLGLPDPLVKAREDGIFRSYKINGIPAISILVIPAATTIPSSHSGDERLQRIGHGCGGLCALGFSMGVGHRLGAQRHDCTRPVGIYVQLGQTQCRSAWASFDGTARPAALRRRYLLVVAFSTWKARTVLITLFTFLSCRAQEMTRRECRSREPSLQPETPSHNGEI